MYWPHFSLRVRINARPSPWYSSILRHPHPTDSNDSPIDSHENYMKTMKQRKLKKKKPMNDKSLGQ